MGDTDYVSLIPLDVDNAQPINITNAVVINGADLKIQKSILQSNNIDFTKSYRLAINTKLSDNEFYSGEFPKLYFGIGTVNITANEANVKLEISGTTGYKKYIDLSNNTTYQLTDLPVGSYTVVAKKDTRNQSYNFNINNNTAQSLTINLSASSIQNFKNTWNEKVKTRNSNSESITEYVSKLKKQWEIMDDYEGGISDGCGNKMPYPNAIVQPPPPQGIQYAYWFSSGTPDAVPPNLPLTKAFGKKIKLVCHIATTANYYSYFKWMSEAGNRCAAQSGQPLPGINHYYDPQLEHSRWLASQPIKIKWKFVDDTLNKEQSGVNATDMYDILQKKKSSLEEITKLTGYFYNQGVPGWGPQFTSEIEVPKNYLRPKLTINLESYHADASTNPNYYGIWCMMEKEVENLPRIKEITAINNSATALNSIIRRNRSTIIPNDAAYNGDTFMETKLFPTSLDNEITNASGQFGLTKMFDLKLKFKVKTGTFYPGDINKLKVTLKFNGFEQSKDYNISPNDIQLIPDNTEEFIMIPEIKVSDLLPANIHQNIVDKDIELIFKPFGDNIDVNKVTELTMKVKPMFDLKQHTADICLNEIYNTEKVSAYVTASFANLLKKYAGNMNDPAKFRCNDGSLPYGGRFPPHNGHNEGKTIDVRYFNTNKNQQEFYDGNDATQRRNDLEKYLNFSHWAYKLETDTNYFATKQALYDKCMDVSNPPYAPLTPCTTTSIVTDLTREKILQLCQWHSETDNLCNSEVSGFKDAIKRYSIWVEKNTPQLQRLRADFKSIRMSLGEARMPDNLKIPLGPYSLISDWQLTAINDGKWPDQFKIYKIDGSNNITNNSVVLCHDSIVGCGINSLFKKDSTHFHHIHIA